MGKAVEKFFRDKREAEKNYRTSHDVKRLHHIMAVLTHLRDYPAPSVIASLSKELTAMNVAQAARDAEHTAAQAKAFAAAQAADAAAQKLTEKTK
jgi:hypothetical protein